MVDADTESVEVWDFEAGAATATRYVDRVPIRLSGRSYGNIQLAEIFAPEL